MLCHQLAQKCDPVHARHLRIQGDDIGHFIAYARGRDERIGGDAKHFDIRISGQYIRQCLAHRRGIIDNQYPHPFSALRHPVIPSEKQCS